MKANRSVTGAVVERRTGSRPRRTPSGDDSIRFVVVPSHVGPALVDASRSQARPPNAVTGQYKLAETSAASRRPSRAPPRADALQHQVRRSTLAPPTRGRLCQAGPPAHDHLPEPGQGEHHGAGPGPSRFVKTGVDADTTCAASTNLRCRMTRQAALAGTRRRALRVSRPTLDHRAKYRRTAAPHKARFRPETSRAIRPPSRPWRATLSRLTSTSARAHPPVCHRPTAATLTTEYPSLV